MIIIIMMMMSKDTDPFGEEGERRVHDVGGYRYIGIGREGVLVELCEVYVYI